MDLEPELPSWLGWPLQSLPAPPPQVSKLEAQGSVFAQKISTSIFIPFSEAEESQFKLIAVYQTSWFLTPWIFSPLKVPTTCENEQMESRFAFFASHTIIFCCLLTRQSHGGRHRAVTKDPSNPRSEHSVDSGLFIHKIRLGRIWPGATENVSFDDSYASNLGVKYLFF